MAGKETDYISQEELEAAHALAETGEAAITEAEESDDPALNARAKLVRMFFKDRGFHSQGQERFEVLFQSSSDAIMTLEPPDWSFSAGNPAAIKIFGAKDEADFSSRPPWDYSPEMQPDGQLSINKAREMITIAMREGSHSFEWKYCTVDDKEFDADVLLTRFAIEGRSRLQATVRDITKQKMLEDQLRQSQKMEAIGQLAGGIAHDFNNLLTAILANAELSKMKTDPKSQIFEDLEAILQAARRAAELTSQLLAFSKKQVLQPRVISVIESLKDLEKMAKRVIPEDIKLSFKADINLDLIEIDPTQFERVMLNLFINARDAMPDGGDIEVSATNKRLDQHEVSKFSNLRTGRHLQICVKDTGVGIPPDHIDNIFDPFFSTKGTKGTGLGLSSVRGTIHQSGGDIVVESTVDEGTTFTILFPSLRVSNANFAAPDQRSVEIIGHGNVVVVEDEAMVRKVTGRILVMSGFSVESFDSGKSALNFFDGNHEGETQFKPDQVDLVVSDVKMPGMNGPKLVGILREKYPNMKVLLVSGHAADTHRIDTTKQAFLQKPYSMRVLIERVKKLIEGESEGK